MKIYDKEYLDPAVGELKIKKTRKLLGDFKILKKLNLIEFGLIDAKIARNSANNKLVFIYQVPSSCNSSINYSYKTIIEEI